MIELGIFKILFDDFIAILKDKKFQQDFFNNLQAS